MYLIEPYNPFDKHPRKKHWTEIAEEEALYHQLVLEKIGQQQTQNDSVLSAVGEGPNATGAGAGGVPPLSFFMAASTALSPPSASDATNANSNSFRANWQLSTGATTYFIDVSTTGSFSSFVAGFQNKSLVISTSSLVTGLTSDTDYFYRLRAANTTGTSSNSNIIMLHTDPFNALSGTITLTTTVPLYYVQGKNTEGGGGQSATPTRAITAGTHILPLDTITVADVTLYSIVFGYLDSVNAYNIDGNSEVGSGGWWLLYESDDTPNVWQPTSIGMPLTGSGFPTFHEATGFILRDNRVPVTSMSSSGLPSP